MTYDLNIGFRQEPAGLEQFLRKEEYKTLQRSESFCSYAKKAGKNVEWPALFYYKPPRNLNEGEAPDWKKTGEDIVSELEVEHTQASTDEALRIAKAIMEKYNAVLFDGKEYLRSQELIR